MTRTGDRRQGSWRDVLLVYRREIDARMLTKGYLIGLLATAAAVVGLVIAFSPSDSPKAYTVAVCGGPAGAFGPVPQGIRTRPCADAADARALTGAKHADAAVVAHDGAVSVLVRGDTAQPARDAAVALGRQWATTTALRSRHVDTARLARDIAAAGPHLVTVGGGAGHGDTGQLGAAVGMVFVLFMQIFGQGAAVAQGVVEEKSTRIVEVLLSTLTPVRLMIGKVAGIGTAALTQIFVMAAALVGTRYAEHTRTMTLPGTVALVSGVCWFLLSFVLFAFLFAAAGSLVSRPEELQSVLMPIMLIAMAPLAVAAAAAGSITAPWVAVVRYIPPFSGLLMPLEASVNAVSPEQQLLAAGVMLLVTAACAWLGARIYRNSILRIGATLRWRQGWAA